MSEAAPVRSRGIQPAAAAAPAPAKKESATVSPKNVPKEASGEKLADIKAQVIKKHGANIIRRASEKQPFKHIPTGIFLLDMALNGGVPEGCATQFFGWESSGKTTTAMRVAANAQVKYPDKKVLFADFEGTYDPLWGAIHGIDNEEMELAQFDSGEQGLDVVEASMSATDVSLIVVDSLPCITPMKEYDKSLEDPNQPGAQARLIGRFLSKMVQQFIVQRKAGHAPTVLFINQWRNKIGGMGDPRILPGGNQLRYAHSVGVEIKNKTNDEGKDANGNNVFSHNEHSFKIHKNKTGNSLPAGEYTMIRNPDHPLGQGWIDDAETVVTFARRFGIMTGEGSAPKRFDDLDESFGTFKQAAEYMYSDLDYFDKIKNRMIGMQRQKMGLSPNNWYLDDAA